MSSVVSIGDVCSGVGPTGQTYGEYCSTRDCGAAITHVPMHRIFLRASSDWKLCACAGPPMTANTPAAAALSASALAATSSVLAAGALDLDQLDLAAVQLVLAVRRCRRSP